MSDVGYAASEDSKHVALHDSSELSDVEPADGYAEAEIAEATVAALARATKPLRVTTRLLRYHTFVLDWHN